MKKRVRIHEIEYTHENILIVLKLISDVLPDGPRHRANGSASSGTCQQHEGPSTRRLESIENKYS
jgi:hypothetical protein